ncbi:MAG TPA: hypothetical protein VGE01_04960 [Fimbriimonas sp.]
MVSVLLLALSLPQGVIEVTRGGALADGSGYWAVEDTTLDASAPDEHLGSSLTLMGGPNRTVLIRFADLDRVAGEGKRIKAARLVLTPLSEKPELREASRVLVPWHEGPMRPLLARGSTGTPVRWASTWKSRQTGEGGKAWQDPGAGGSADATPIEGLTTSATESEYVVDGLGPAVERMRERWYENHGIALRFANPVEFYSSQAGIGRPRLVLELEEAPEKTGADLGVYLIEANGENDRTYVAHVRNVGTEPARGFSANWLVNGNAGAAVDMPAAIAPGEETTLTFRRSHKKDDTDHRTQPLGLRIVPLGDDATPANDYLEIQESGLPVNLTVAKGSEDAWQRMVREWNEVYSTQSRYSFAPDGSLERLRIASFTVEPNASAPSLRALGVLVGLPDLSKQQVVPGSGALALTLGSVDPFPGVMGGGDTRYEGGVPGTMWLPYEPRPFEPFDVIPPDATGLLSATEVATLNANLGRRENRIPYAGLPSSVLIRVQDDGGRVLNGTEVNFFQQVGGKIDLGAPAFTVATNEHGVAVLPKREGGLFGDLGADPTRGVFLVRAQQNGVTAYSWLKAWQAADAFARGNAAVAIADLRFNLPGVPLDAGVNLAANRIVSDSRNSAPAKLASLVDGNDATPIDLPAGKDAWVEIDLGRDRTIGEIRLSGASDEVWRRFDIVAYGTGQLVNTVRPLVQERDWVYASRMKSGNLEPVRSVAYRLPGGRYRFIRIIGRSGEAAKLNEIRVVPAKAEGS